MPKLRHLALHTADPESTANFYKRVFDMKELHRSKSPMADGMHLSDGTVHLALLRYRSPELAAAYGSSSALGMSHIGFWLDEADAEEIRRRLTEAGAVRGEGPGVGAPGVFFEEKWRGPDGVVIDLSDAKIGQAQYQAKLNDGERLPKLNHIALYSSAPERTANFYKRVFAMQESGRGETAFAETISLSDGYVDFSVAGFRSPEIAAQRHYPCSFGLSHFGFLVEDREAAAQRLCAVGAERVKNIPNVADKWKGPDGVVFDITDKG